MTGREPLETVDITTIDKTHPWYLAHSLGQRFVVRDKIEKELNRNGITTLNPFADRPFLYTKEFDTERQILLNHQTNTRSDHDVVEGDLQAIWDCGGVIAVINEASFGMAMEIFHASYTYGMDVYIILGKGMEDLRYHPWLCYLCEGIIVLD